MGAGNILSHNAQLKEENIMTLKECYEKLGADYEGVLQRMAGKEALVQRFALKFLKDTSYSDLKNALTDEDYENAFRASHTLKGVASNLGFVKIVDSAHSLTEQLRGGSKPENDNDFTELSAAYEETIAMLSALEQ